MRSAILVGLFLIYVALTAFLEQQGGGRITIADLLLVLLALIAAMVVMLRRRLLTPAVHLSALPLLFVFAASALFAVHPDRAVTELLAIAVGFLGSWAIADLLVRAPSVWFDRMAQGYVLTIGLLATVCLVDFLVMPGLISSRNLGGLQGPFNNTGQAGSFFGVHGAIGLALIMSGVVPRRLLYIAACASTILALLATFKRASILGLSIGVGALLLQMILSSKYGERKTAIKFVIIVALFVSVGTPLFYWVLENVPGARWRFEVKFTGGALERASSGFIRSNFTASLQAFSEHPILGVGLDNVREIYHRNEVHSSYIGVLAYGGVIGFVAYLLFIGAIVREFVYSGYRALATKYGLFLYYLAPLFLGLMISWGYTYHLRKREFWILIVFVVVAAALARGSAARSTTAKLPHRPGD